MRLVLTPQDEAEIRERLGEFGETVLEEARTRDDMVGPIDFVVCALRRLVPAEQLEPSARPPVELRDPPKRECEHPENWLVRHPDPSRLLYGCRMCGAELSAAEIVARPRRC